MTTRRPTFMNATVFTAALSLPDRQRSPLYLSIGGPAGFLSMPLYISSVQSGQIVSGDVTYRGFCGASRRNMLLTTFTSVTIDRLDTRDSQFYLDAPEDDSGGPSPGR